MGITTALAVPPMLFIINADVSYILLDIVAIIAGVLVSMTGPNVRSVLQDVCVPETRGTAFALFNLTDDIGKGGGPVLVAALIKSFHGNRK